MSSPNKSIKEFREFFKVIPKTPRGWKTLMMLAIFFVYVMSSLKIPQLDFYQMSLYISLCVFLAIVITSAFVKIDRRLEVGG